MGAFVGDDLNVIFVIGVVLALIVCGTMFAALIIEYIKRNRK